MRFMGTFLRIAIWGGMLATAYLTAGFFADEREEPKEGDPPG